MANPIPPASSAGRPAHSAQSVEKSPVEARQGFRGRPVLYVLGVSLALAVVAYIIIHFYFFGSHPGPGA